MGFLVAIPKPGVEPPAASAGPPSLEVLRRDYDLRHGSEVVPESFMRGFVRRRQQIGQLEILAALVPYLSCAADLRGRRVLHWVDNTSAIAALAKGYSSAPDSARLVHAFHATAGGLGCACYFEYVRSAANVADLPSRVDLRGVEWDCGLPGQGLVSYPVQAVLPAERDWACRAAAWARWARTAAA